jgi:hypothetical protein
MQQHVGLVLTYLRVSQIKNDNILLHDVSYIEREEHRLHEQKGHLLLGLALLGQHTQTLHDPLDQVHGALQGTHHLHRVLGVLLVYVEALVGDMRQISENNDNLTIILQAV